MIVAKSALKVKKWHILGFDLFNCENTCELIDVLAPFTDILPTLGLTRKSKCATLAQVGNKINFFVPANHLFGMTLSETNALNYFTCKCSDPFEGSVEWDFDFGKVLDPVVADFEQVGQPQIRQPEGIVIQISLRNPPILLSSPNQPWVFPRLNIHIKKNINYRIETSISYSLSRGYNIVDWLKFLEFCLDNGYFWGWFSQPVGSRCAKFAHFGLWEEIVRAWEIVECRW